ncbi:acyl-CoA dehydrogenase family protein [Pseudoalteromonas sp. S16_S37]|uniref:acyl-CoA dehydrogenase family protein n=1 Tax=Pseudoalteromonas sp. S16_S37 TaxID=2720228 RepID=UPI001681A002|nr:acyl-CoA dehydrogenase family protein [Pseudoalteromonas sp. S16_S37]MBD1584440.1 acyl-CoA/acyl-ACP dehydrogenase [Pseudoalteromonas sp. S16_S37]
MPTINKDKVAHRYGTERLDLIEFYREVSLKVDDDPDYIVNNFLDSELVYGKLVADLERNNAMPSSTQNRCRVSESLAYGDPGALLATPSPSLSGAIIDEIGSKEQQVYFQNYVLENKCRTFFGVTEPNKGSDASNIETHQFEGKISGEKMLVGNAAAAGIGTILFRSQSKFLDMRAAIITPELLASEFIERSPLNMTIIRGCNLGYVRIKDMPLDEQYILGNHLGPMQQGIMSLIKVFNRFRPSVSAMAVGVAQAIVDHVQDNYANVISPYQLKLLEQEIELARQTNLDAARCVDTDPYAATPSSLAKIKCCAVAKKAAHTVNELLQEAVLFDPWLSKAVRDVYAFEWMEGTTNIHLNNISMGIKRNEFPCLQNS